MAELSFIFTDDSFSADDIGEEKLSANDMELLVKFRSDKYRALYELAFSNRPEGGSPSLVFLRLIAEDFADSLTAMPEIELVRDNANPVPDEMEIARVIDAIPFAPGSEHIDAEWIRLIFSRLSKIFQDEIAKYNGSVASYLSQKRRDLRAPERVFFHLVENKDGISPFAFLATYATKDKSGRVRHMPLSYALTEFKKDRDKLLSLLGCLNRAAEVSPIISGFVESGEMFHPLRLSAGEACELLRAVPSLEESGIMCRVPNWWKRRSSSVRFTLKIGGKKKNAIGIDSLLSVQPELTLDGMPLTKAEIKKLLAETAGLAQIKGKWVEVDKEKLQKLLDEMDACGNDISFFDALKMESGMAAAPGEFDTSYTNSAWLEEIMRELRQPDLIKKPKIPKTVRAKLRPYQETGYSWLHVMAGMGFGACLADDMGLGKTLQVLTFLEDLRLRKKDSHILLIVPASLIGNWEKEAARFTPKINISILHGRSKEVLDDPPFLTITTYQMASRLTALSDVDWDGVILDEAQAIKNPGTKQTRSIKKLKSRIRIAMTGTPIENDMTNLWSLFDFLNQGLLGNASEFKKYSAALSKRPENFSKLRRMISPFILRRLKTDKTIIADLPDKMEQTDYIPLSKKQIVLYKNQVRDLEKRIGSSEGIERRGMVLATITKLKQICNHPDQYLGLTGYNPEESGKFSALREICETIRDKRERALIFTQYREITEYLAAFLKKIFGRKGLTLHGGTRVNKRSELVEMFNGEEYVPFMVLSVKAAGTGLNLTAANHVIHFDRWWNPAVENQATDRAYRIGQKKDVIVHKLVSKGTIEERIDEIINEKKDLAESLIGTGEKWITELSDNEIISLMRLEV